MNKRPKKRKDECYKCSSRSCYNRIVNETFDELACSNHINDLEKYSDEVLGKNNGVYRTNISSTGKLKRGEKYV